MMTEAAMLGLGYIIGLRYSLIIACGSFLVAGGCWCRSSASWARRHRGGAIVPARRPLDELSASRSSATSCGRIGIGAIAMSGMIGVWKSRRIIVGAFKLGVRGRQAGSTAAPASARSATCR